MSSYFPLDPKEEAELHRSRLLNVEEKPFKRITNRLLTPGSLILTPSKLPTPPTDSSEETAQDAERQKAFDDLRQFREDVLLDFATFDSSIARIQFLRNSNERERERYKADKQRILDTAQQVKDNTAQLRLQLEEAKKTLEQRKKFDQLAEKITSNVFLKVTREDQQGNLEKLEDECRELERESRMYGETWKERREQFGRIVEEGMQLRRLIRDEKEEVERREGMDGGQEDGEVGETGSRGGQTPKHSSFSGNATPRTDAAANGDEDAGLKPTPMSVAGSRAGSRALSPTASDRGMPDSGDTVEDSMMAEDGAKAEESGLLAADTPMGEVEEETAGEGTPQVTVQEPGDEMEEGEAEDKMDTT